jgi:hypothetical protein
LKIRRRMLRQSSCSGYNNDSTCSNYRHQPYFLLFILTRYLLPQFLHFRSFDFPCVLVLYPRDVLLLLPHDGHRDGFGFIMDVSPREEKPARVNKPFADGVTISAPPAACRNQENIKHGVTSILPRHHQSLNLPRCPRLPHLSLCAHSL